MIFHDFNNCTVFMDIRHLRHLTCRHFALSSSNRVNVIRETFIFYALLCCLMFVSHFSAGQSFALLVFDSFFFIWETKKW